MPSAYEPFIKKYGGLTEIQKLAMPIVEGGQDCLIAAPTGSGKTEAAVLPVLQRIINGAPGRNGIFLLYITPLRALNRDMLKRLDLICSALGLTIAVRHGDTAQSERARQSRKAPNVLITTPETLQSILPTSSFREAFLHLEAVIIDEVHELYGSKRGAQLSVALERLELLKPGFQRIGLGATIGNMGLVARFLNPARGCRVVSSEGQKRMHIRVELPERAAKPIGTAESKFGLDREASARLSRLAELIAAHKATLIFANTRQVVEAVGSRLTFMERELDFGKIGIHHGSLSNDERVKIEDGLKEGYVRAVIATSSLELGIDVGGIDLVVQYGSPKQAVRLLQRVGRSGHTASEESNGIIIATSMMDVVESLAVCINAAAGALESSMTHDGALDVLAHQVCGLLLDLGPMTADAALGILARSYIYRELKADTLLRVLEFMHAQHIIRFEKNSIEPVGRTRMFYYEHVSFIPDSRRFVVKDSHTNRVISSLDERFVMNYVDEGSVFITKGLPWRVLSIEEHTIIAELSSDFEAAVPDWSGEDIPVARMVSESVYALLSGKYNSEIEDYSGAAVADKVRALSKAQEKSFLPDATRTVIEETGDFKLIYSPLGTLANDALAKLLSHLIVTRFGKPAAVRISPYSILIESHQEYDPFAALKGLSERELLGQLGAAAAESAVFLYKFADAAVSFGVVEKGSSMPRHTVLKLAKVLKDTPVYEEAIRELLYNYFDTSALLEFASRLNSGEIRAARHACSDLSPLGRLILESAYSARELVLPLTPNSVVVDSFAEHVLGKKADLLCTYCGMRFIRKLSDLEQQGEIRCPNCKSNMLAEYSEQRAKVTEKRLSKKRLSQGERALLKEMLDEAGLFTAYGGKAAIALGTYGVGHKSAARALRMFRKDRREFFMDLIEVQRQFIRTKKYWST